MKKKIIALSAALMLFAGVVSASSINGDYKGNPIVKIMSNGKQLETDEVPGVILDGHTVVPISTLRQLGASVTWDAYGYSVDVKLPTTTPEPSPNKSVNNTSDIALIKGYSTAANLYRQLTIVGDAVSEVATYTIGAADVVGSNIESQKIQLAENQITYANEMITKSMNASNDVYDNLLSLGIDISGVKAIILDYALVLKTYGLALDSVKSHNANNYTENIQNGMDQLGKVRSKVNDNYFEYYNKIQNY